MNNVSLICHVERCSQNDRGAERCFSVNLSVALGDGAPGDGTPELLAAVQGWLRPWKWAMGSNADHAGLLTTKVTVALTNNDGTATVLDDVPAFAPLLTDKPAAAAWVAVLETRLKQFTDKTKRDAFLWNSTAQAYEYNGDDPDSLDTPTAQAGRRWFAELLDLSRETAPLPHAAQLAFHFWIDEVKLGSARTVTAAPSFAFAPGETVRRPAKLDRVGGRVQWMYEEKDSGGVALDPKVTAHANEAPVVPGGPWEKLWADGWVDLAGAYFAEDWLAELEWRAADLFDLPALLLGHLSTLKDEPDKEGTPFKKALQLYQPIIERALRDLAQTGASCCTRMIPGAPTPRVGDATLLNDFGLAADVLREVARLEGKWQNGGRLDPTFAAEAAEILKKLETWETAGDAPAGGTKNLEQWWKDALARAGAESIGRPYDLLRARQAFLADEERTRELVFEQWDYLLATSTAWPGHRRERVRSTVLPSLGVRKRLAMMHLGVQWEAIVAALHADGSARRTPSELSKELTKLLTFALGRYLTDRARLAPEVFTDRPFASATTAPDAFDGFFEWLHGHVLATVSQGVLAGSDHPDELEPGFQPDGVLFQVADVQGEASADDDPNDPLRGVAGFGLLLREKEAEPHCLNFADIHAETGSEFLPMQGSGAKLTTRAVVPVRVVGRNGVRRCLIGYNNEPLCAESPVAALAQNHHLRDGRAAGGAFHRTSWARLANPYRTGDPLLPGLRFSQEYQAAAFVIGVGNSLPRGFADKDALDVTKPAADQTKWGPCKPDGTPDPKRWFDFTYRRRVAVSQVRLQSPGRKGDKTGDELQLPPIPASVHPLARSLRVLAEERRARAAAELQESAGLAPGEEYAELLDRVLGESAAELQQSLVLLVPPTGEKPDQIWDRKVATTRFPFEVLRPAIDLRVWDRSFLFLKGDAPVTDLRTQRPRKQRELLWKESFETAKDRLDAPPGTNVTIDDPAVEKLLVRMTRLFPEPSEKEKEQLPVTELIDFTGWTGTGGLKNERATALPCVVRSVEAMPAKPEDLIIPPDPHGDPSKDETSWRIAVPKGELWLLELCPVIPTELKSYFQERLWSLTFEEWTDRHTKKEYRLGAPRRFLLETATDVMPTESDLHAALCARAVAGGALGPMRETWTPEPIVWRERAGAEALRAGWRTEVALDPSRLGHSDAAGRFHWIHRVSVLAQRWRWNGRPLRDAWDEASENTPDSAAGLPPEKRPWTPPVFFEAWAGGDEAQLTAWDGRLFGDRAGTDYRRHDATIDLTAGGGPLAGAHRVFHQDVSGDPGAIYFRYAIQVHSRYEGLRRPRAWDSRDGLKPATPEAWRRLVVPCRHDKDLPPPRIKLVLPLTDIHEAVPGADGGSRESTPGLLVVLSEPWFRYGGLAEELIAEIASADEPVRPKKSPPDPTDPALILPRRLAEFGPDPIITGKPTDVIIPPDEAFPGAISFTPLPAYGPIGHTFDTDTLAPEFVHTSFIVPPPELRDADGKPMMGRDLAWYFIKLRFRRRIEAAGLALAPDTLESEATGPLWAQFLPPSSHFATDDPSKPVHIAKLRLASQKKGAVTEWFIAHPPAPKTPVKLRGTAVEGEAAGAARRFQLWALVTEPLFDAFGRLSQESFLDFCPLEDGVLLPKNKTWTTDTQSRRRVRVIEVQVLHSQEKLLRDADNVDAVRGFFFPEDPRNLAEARARCVRVSDPVDPLLF